MDNLINKSKSELIAEIERLRDVSNAMNDFEAYNPFLLNIIQQLPHSYISLLDIDLKLQFTFGHEFAELPNSPSSFLELTPEDIYGVQAPFMREKLLNTLAGKDQHFELFISERYFQYKTTPIKDDSGKIKSILSIAEDITEVRKANRMIKESEAKFRTLYDNAPLSYQSLNEDGTFKDINPTWLSTLGYDRDEVIGKYYGDFLHPKWKVHFEKNFPEFKKRGYVHDVQFKIRHKNGDYRDISFEGCVGYNPDGSFKQTYCVFQDITERKKAEDALLETHMLNEAIIANVHEGIIVYDKELRIKLWNPFMEKLTSFKSEEIVNKTAEDIFPPIVRKEVFGKLRLVLENKPTPISTFQYQRSLNGENVWLSDQSTPLKNESGEVIGAIGVVRNITDKLAAEKSLRESEEKFRAVFEQSPIAIEIFDNKGRLLNINQKTMELFGLDDKKHVIGFDLWTDPNLSKHQINKLKNGQSVKLSIDFDFDLVKEHNLYPSSRSGMVYMDMYAIPLLNANDKHGYLVQIIETTEQKQNEIKLKESEEGFSTTFKLSPVPASLSKLSDSCYTQVNLAWCNFFEYSSDEAIGCSAQDLNILSLDTARRMENEHKDKGIIQDFEVNISTKNGEQKDVRSSVEIISIGGESYALNMVVDITEQKRYLKELTNRNKYAEDLVLERTKELADKTKKLEKSQQALTFLLEDVNESRKQLQQSNTKLLYANEELESFSYSVSHDLRAPLRAIDGYSKILLEDYEQQLDDEGKRLFSVIIQNTNNMRQLIDDILALSRLGRKQLILDDINTNVLVKNIVSEIKNDNKERNIHFELEDLPLLRGDSGMIKQLFINLISNSVKFTKHESLATIKIGISNNENKTVFSVADNGVGFDMKYVSKIFEVFQRLHTSDQFEGTGIGLAIAKRIVNKHNGKIWAKSEPKQGTTIFFELNLDITL